MDALARLEPVARPLLRQVDEALGTLGAPARHEVWPLSRHLGVTPGDLVGGIAGPVNGVSRDVARALRAQADAYRAAPIPAGPAWAGGAGAAYAGLAASLAAHLHGGPPATDSENVFGHEGRPGRGEVPTEVSAEMPAVVSAVVTQTGDESLAGRLVATASYVEEVAAWRARSRDRIARALADVLSSAQAVTLRTARARTMAVPTSAPRPGDEPFAGQPWSQPSAEQLAAADIGAHVLRAGVAALTEGQDLARRWHDRLAELPYRAPVDADRPDHILRLTI